MEINIRAVAAQVITDVAVGGKSLPAALSHRPVVNNNAEDRAFLQELCNGVLRHWHALEFIVNQLVSKPVKARDRDVKHLIMVGIYQLRDMRVPDHAAVFETVNACESLKKHWANKLVNGVLRSYQRRSEQLEHAVAGNDQARYCHSQWLLQKLRDAWPEHWQGMVDANNQRPPMVLRVNQRRASRENYLSTLNQLGITATAFQYNNEGIILEQPVPVERLPGFSDGMVSVQDGAAQLASACLDVQAHQRVLDVCAAPGGKAMHILESCPQLAELVAVDIDGDRLQQVEENLQRLGLRATLVQGDAAAANTWWDGRCFDRILLDAPCSATGVIRRHPDIKLLRKAADIDQLVEIQAKILASVWPLLASEGMLLYATCSVLPQENEQQIQAFVQSRDDVQVVSPQGQWGLPGRYGRQVITGQNNMDGFYYACLQKA